MERSTHPVFDELRRRLEAAERAGVRVLELKLRRSQVAGFERTPPAYCGIPIVIVEG
jgi:hypothetical protein